MSNDHHHHHHHHHGEPDANADAVHSEHLDAAGKSLSDALRVSFVILKVVMIILVGAFLLSGFKTIGSDEVGLLLRFGRFVPVGEDRVIPPGATWVFPYPIDEVVRIPVRRPVSMPIDFWYYQSPSELRNEGPKQRNNVPDKLDPTRDGYLITRGDSAGGDGTDYNIVHTRWELTYKIDDAELFFRRVHVRTPGPGEVYFDVITEDIKPVLKCVFEDAVVTAMVDYTIDDVLERADVVTAHVRRLVQQKFSDIRCGIRVESVQLVDKAWPRQVNDAFARLVTVISESGTEISNAKTEASAILSGAAGSAEAAEALYKAINDPNVPDQELERLWSGLSGEANNKILDAEAYRTTVARNAEANADYLRSLLPEYRKNPELVVQRIYLDAIENVLAGADEKIVMEPSDLSALRQLRVLLNRDMTLKRQTGQKPATQEQPDQP